MVLLNNLVVGCLGLRHFDVYFSDSQASPGGPSLKLNIEDVKSTTLTLAWSINGVSPLATTRLHMDIKDKDGRTLLSQSLPGQTRSFNLHTLQPGTDYIAELRMFERNREGREEMLARDRIVMKTLAADTDRATQPPQGEYGVYIVINVPKKIHEFII